MAFTCSYLASASGLLITTSVSPFRTFCPSSTKKVSIRPGSLPEMRISVASICPCRMTGLRPSIQMPNAETITTTTRMTTNAMLRYFLELSMVNLLKITLSILCPGRGLLVHYIGYQIASGLFSGLGMVLRCENEVFTPACFTVIPESVGNPAG